LAQCHDIIKRHASKQQQATLDTCCHRLGARRHSELVEEQLQMSFHRVGGDAESRCDLLVDQAVGEKGENLSLTIAEERADCRFAARALPDVRRKPLPVSVSKAVAAAAAARRGLPKVGAFAPVELPKGDAKALVEKTCGTGCHSVEVVTSQRMNEKDWNAVVQGMVARGAQASDAEVRVIVEYLGKTLGR